MTDKYALSVEVTSERMAAAVSFAAAAHDGQMRGDGETPYIVHPLMVMDAVAGLFPDEEDMQIAALFHDLVEDTAVTTEQIRMAFGPVVAHLVAEVTDQPGLDKNQRRDAQLLKMSNIGNAALFIKVVDKLANLFDLNTAPPKNWSDKSIDGYRAFSIMYLGKALEEFKRRGVDVTAVGNLSRAIDALS